MNTTTLSDFGPMLREWRTRRRMSQLDLATDADVSQRHLSFVESGRSKPSRDMVLKLAEHLSIPLRQRNRLLTAAGYASGFSERTISDPALGSAMQAVRQVLKAHEPNLALAVDRHWNLIEANAAVSPFLAAVEDRTLLQPPMNVLRLCLHPKGLAPGIVNLAEWKSHILLRLRRQNDLAGDPALTALEKELEQYPGGPRTQATAPESQTMVAHPLKMRTPGGVLSFISTITVFGTAVDITLAEIAIETFFPADDATRRYLRALPI